MLIAATARADEAEPPAETSAAPVPVVLVHGFASHPRMWRGTARLLEEAGFLPVPVAWEPEEGMGIPEAARDVLAPRVEEALAALGVPPDAPLFAVGHSTGGLLLRWLVQQEGWDRIQRLALLSTPNHGARTGVARIACDTYRQPWRAVACDLIPGSAALEALGPLAPSEVPTLSVGVETVPNLLPAPLYDGDGDGRAHTHDNAVMAESAWLEGATFRIWRGRRHRSHFSVSCSSAVNGWVLAFFRGESVPEQARGLQVSEDVCGD